MWRDAALIAAKDLRIELRSRVLLNQLAPMAMLMLVLFAFALGPGRGALVPAAPGLFWTGTLFSALLAVQRSWAVEPVEGAHDPLHLAGMDSSGIFFGKLAAVLAELLTLEVLLGIGVVVLFGARVASPAELLLSTLAGTVGLAAVGVLYGALASGMHTKETLFPLLFLPVASPVLVAGTRAWQVALGTAHMGAGPWMTLLVVFAALYLSAGVLLYGPLEGTE